MSNILNIHEGIETANKLRQEKKHIVLAGGCFDILHIGHITFLEEAKKKADFLVVLLESDEAVRKNKEDGRPIQKQEDRARILSSLRFVDYVVLLPNALNDKEYDHLVKAIKPAIIATTKGDPQRQHKERQGKAIHARVVDVTERIPDTSSSRMAMLLSKYFNL